MGRARSGIREVDLGNDPHCIQARPVSAPDGFLPIFGTVSFASVVVLLVGLRSLLRALRDDIIEAVVSSEALEKLIAKGRESCAREYATKEDLGKVRAIARHAEACVPGCPPLRETSALPREASA